ncbi:hypothetical protein ACWGJT_26105 [Streptomyces xantholiticus]
MLTQSDICCQRLAMVGASRCNPHHGEWSSYTHDRRKASERKAKAAAHGGLRWTTTDG